MINISELKFNEKGLIPVIVQDKNTLAVLMQAWMSEESIKLTLESNEMVYFSRSRNCLWKKGETSGNTQKLIELRDDCDKDCLLAIVEQKGVACHTGSYSCFGNDLKDINDFAVINELVDVIEDRKVNPQEGSYTNYLLMKGMDKILKKIGEEAGEVIIAAKNEAPDEVAPEVADLAYHTLVLLAYMNMSPKDVLEELKKRR